MGEGQGVRVKRCAMTMSDAAMMILRQHVAEKGQAQVGRELGISGAAVSQALSGKYRASTARIEARVMTLYGHGGALPCPVQGEITPAECASTFEKAKKIGLRAGNPATLRLFKTCLSCPLRNGGTK
jgi:hypothetical protein